MFFLDFYLFVHYFERVSQLENKLFYLAVLYINIYIHISALLSAYDNPVFMLFTSFLILEASDSASR